MTKRFFTSDNHFDDHRIDIFSRPFKTVQEMNDVMVANWNSVVGEDDIVYHLGDFAVKPSGYEYAKKLNGKIHLILGNYDIDNIKNFNHQLFESISSFQTVDIQGTTYYLTHMPVDANPGMFSLVGHIHGLWKVQRKMINVSTDAWHFFPIPEEKIEFQRNGIVNHYDDNVFIAEYILKQAEEDNGHR